MTPAERRRLDALIQAEAHERDENLHGFRNLLVLLVCTGIGTAGLVWLLYGVVTGEANFTAAAGAAALIFVGLVAWLSTRGERR